MSNLAECEVLAMALPESERWKLADKLVESLSVDCSWTPQEIMAEALKRDSEMDMNSGSVMSEEEFWADLKQRSGS